MILLGGSMMTKRLSRADIKVIMLYAIFAAIVAYILQARFTEEPSVLVDHYEAGAGDLLLVLLCPLTIVVSIVPAYLWSAPSRPKSPGLLLAVLVVPILVMLGTMVGLERRASRFDYDAFVHITTAYDRGSVITQEQAIQALGTPLSQELIDGREVWSYTYMPSTGLGWHKRVLTFGKSGQMIGYVNMDEP
jgi:hypothetical protein